VNGDEALVLAGRILRLACAIFLAAFFGLISLGAFSEQRWGAVPLAVIFLYACLSCVFSAYKIVFRKE
jgi:hypothetical protein